MADDYAGDTTTTGVLIPGVTVEGTLEIAGDRDWFAVDLVGGDGYNVRMRGDLFASGVVNQPVLDLYSAEGVLIRSAGFVGARAKLDFIPPPSESGQYFVSVRSDSGDTGHYVIDLIDPVEDEDATEADPFDMTVGQTVVAEIDSRQFATARNNVDDDWFAIDLTAGESYWIEADGRAIPLNRAGGLLFYLHGPDGTEVAASTPFGPLTLRAGLSFTPGETGRYTIAVDPVNDGSLYELSVSRAVTLTGTAGADWLVAPDGFAARVMAADGGAGRDMLSFADFQPNGLTINLASGLIRSEVRKVFDLIATGIEDVTGTRYGDTIYGSAGADRVRGLGDADTFHGSAGADRLEGGSGRDTVDYSSATAGVSASLLRDRGWSGDAAGDRYDSIQALTGSRFADSLWGDHGANRLEGGAGDDTITGNGGDDYILAGFGTDVIVFSGNQADYTITRAGFRTEITDTLGRDGTDIIAHAEVLRFADGDLIL